MAIPKLALIPSGVKAGKLYSVLPTNGDGDFTTTRNTVATRVNESGLIEEVASNVPRLDYSDGTCPSLLLENSSTNLMTYSEDFSNAYWIKSGSSVTSGFASPDGTANAFKLTEDTSAGVHGLTSDVSGLTIGNTYTISIYAKAGGNNYMYMRFRYAGNTDVMFDLANGTIGVTGSAVLSQSINLMANGYYKCTITALAGTITEGFRVYNSSNGTDVSYAGDGTSGVYIYGAQLEQNSYSTSYIKTVGTAQTRVADTATDAGNSTVINSTEGVLYAEISALANDGTNRRISLNDSSDNNRINFMYTSALNQIVCNYKSNGITRVSLNNSSYDTTLLNKIAFKWKQEDFSLWINGTEVAVDNNTITMMNSNSLEKLDFIDGSGSNPFYGKTKSVQVYTTALSDSELQALTSN